MPMHGGGQVVVITGAAGALGRAVAQAFAALGATRALLDRRREELEAAHGAGDARTLLAVADLLAPAELERAVGEAIERFGRIDTLVNVAGGFWMGGAVHETPDDAWDAMIDLNARSVLATARVVVPHMLAAGAGCIVNVGAYAALSGKGGMGAYVASKSATIRLTESMSAELRERGIRVNCVLPSIIDTPANRAAMPDADPARWVAPQALADVIAFLASDGARAVHGAAIPVVGLS